MGATGATDRGVVAGRYELQGEIASGGMATVYRAVDRTSGKHIALKRMKTDVSGAAAALFRREFHTLVQLRHPRIIEVYDYGLEGESPFYTMELLDGSDLNDLAPIPVPEACRHLRDVASSLALLHARRLLHRDVSPRNVRITGDGRAKLIDFGAMASFGPNTHVVGTPVGVPPEALHGLELDQRADLFGLGALAYLVLTGQHAYPARNMAALHVLWRSGPPRPPSKLTPDIPPALDALVLSLLSLDKKARPATAAEVIARLDAIVPPTVKADEEVTAAYLVNPELVGRAAELGQLEDALAGTDPDERAGIYLHGPPGVGRTRLLAEGTLQAQLSGQRVLHVDAEQHPGPLGALRALLLTLTRDEDAAREAVRPELDTLGHLDSALEKRSTAPLRKLPKDRSERADALQRAAVRALGRLADKETLVVALDNAHAADPQSLTTLGALWREVPPGRIALLLSVRDHEEVAAPQVLQALQALLTPMAVDGLDVEGTAELVRALFGQVDYAGRMGRWLFDATGGNPGQCVALCRRLVDLGRVSYQDGQWVLPSEQPRELAEANVTDLHEQRLGALSDDAASLLCRLSVSRRPLSIQQVLALSRFGAEETFGLLDELVSRGIVLATGETYRFAHESLRTHAQHKLSAQDARQAHQRVGELLLQAHPEGNADALMKIEAGFHFLHGQDALRGAGLLDDAALRLVTSLEGLRFAAPALEAALEVYEREHKSQWSIFAILDGLTAAGWYVDYAYAARYGDRTLDLALELSGLSIGDRLAAFIGEKRALKVSLAVGAGRHALQKRHIRARSQRTFTGVFTPLVGSVGIMIGVAANTFNGGEARRVLRKARMLRAFDDDHVLSVMYDYARYFTLASEGRLGEAEPIAHRVLAWFESETGKQSLGEEGCRALAGGVMTGIVMFSSLRDDFEMEPWAKRLEALGLSFYAGMAKQARFVGLMRRAHIAASERHREELEQLAVEGGTTWQSSLVVPLVSAGVAARTGDLVALRSWTEAMMRLSNTVPVLRAYATVYGAQLAALRGEQLTAVSMLDSVREATGPRQWLEWPLTQAIRARALIAMGEHARAKNVLQSAKAQLHPSDAPYTFSTLDLELAEIELLAATGQSAEAKRTCDALIALHAPNAGSLTMSLLHELAGKLALAAEDEAAATHHMERLEHFARVADNHTLIAKAKQLEHGVDALVHRRTASSAASASTAFERIRTELASIAVSERPAAALQLLLESVGADAGHLYVREGERLVPVASHPRRDTPPQRLTEQLSLLTAIEPTRGDDATMTATAATVTPAESEAFVGLDVRLLVSASSRSNPIVGAVALRKAQGSRTQPAQALLDAIAESLPTQHALQPTLPPPRRNGSHGQR